MGTIFCPVFSAYPAQRAVAIFPIWCKLLNLFILSVLKIPTFNANLVFKSHFWCFWQVRHCKYEHFEDYCSESYLQTLYVWFCRNVPLLQMRYVALISWITIGRWRRQSLSFLQPGKTVCCSLKSIIQKLVKGLKKGQPISKAKQGKLATQTRETNDFFLPVPCADDVQ